MQVYLELTQSGALSKHDSEIGHMLAEKDKQPRLVRFFGPGQLQNFWSRVRGPKEWCFNRQNYFRRMKRRGIGDTMLKTTKVEAMLQSPFL